MLPSNYTGTYSVDSSSATKCSNLNACEFECTKGLTVDHQTKDDLDILLIQPSTILDQAAAGCDCRQIMPKESCPYSGIAGAPRPCDSRLVVVDKNTINYAPRNNSAVDVFSAPKCSLTYVRSSPELPLAKSPNSTSGLSSGAIAGICIAGVAAAVACVGGLLYLRSRNKRKATQMGL
ncbi:hypothetical protein HDU67_001368 [Dinochytrium kinnereticum]|nr:hypothetical protein HDU67_001368 [Dinochytrium kinnereticum]